MATIKLIWKAIKTSFLIILSSYVCVEMIKLMFVTILLMIALL